MNGKKAPYCLEKGYLILDRTWAEGDRIEWELELRPLLFAASPRVPEDAGKAAVVCGPLVYCAEEADNGAGLHRLSLNPSAEPVWDDHPEIPGNGKAVTVSGWRDRDWSGSGALYRPWSGPDRERINIRLIPYYTWANRSPGEMRVWLRMG